MYYGISRYNTRICIRSSICIIYINSYFSIVVLVVLYILYIFSVNTESRYLPYFTTYAQVILRKWYKSLASYISS